MVTREVTINPMRVWLAGVLIALGGLWLLDAAAVLDAGAVIDRWWPVAVIALALLAAVAERRMGLGPTALLVIGVLLLVDQLDLVEVDQILWPLVAVFGGVDVIVPEGWRVQLGGLPIFGGYEDKTHRNGALALDAAVLKVGATAIFGGVTVKNHPDHGD